MAEAILKDVLDKLTSLITEKIGLILGVDKEMQKLSSTLTNLQAVLKDAEILQILQIENSAFRDWGQKLCVLFYEINDILDECNTRGSKLKHSGSKLSRLSLMKFLTGPKNDHEIGSRMKQVTEKLEGVAAEFHLPVDRPIDVAASCETSSLLNRSDPIYDREEDKDKIVHILVNDVKEDQDISVLPIIGNGGLGKTTVAQLVFNDPRVVDHFDIRIWIWVSENFELKTLMNAMIEAATGRAYPMPLPRINVLEGRFRGLFSTKRYLIVLDDVWNEHQHKWFDLKDILSCGSTGASIIVTTRQKKVAHIMGTLPAHCLKGLSDESCWMLLKSRAFDPKEEVSPHLEMIGNEIVKKCAGVPLVAKALGGFLQFKRKEEEWLYVKDTKLRELNLGF